MSKLSTLSRISRQPSLAYYYAQKALRSPGLRHALGGAVAGLVGQPPVAPGVEGAADVAQQLQVDGLCFLPQLELDAVQLQQVHAQLRDKPVFDLYDGQRFDIGQDVPADRIKLSYRSGDLLRCPPLLALANSPLIVDAVTRVLGARPTIGWFESWWTLGEKNAAGRKLLDDVYHRDVDDLRFVKLFAYLTDTDVANGAHSFVRGSHRSSLLTPARADQRRAGPRGICATRHSDHHQQGRHGIPGEHLGHPPAAACDARPTADLFRPVRTYALGAPRPAPYSLRHHATWHRPLRQPRLVQCPAMNRN
jgi:hypothetical protein